MKRVLITGGAGFIGSHFVNRALRTHPDWQILNVDKLTYAGNRANLPTHPRHEFIHCDILDTTALTKMFQNGGDLVIHFAAETHVDRSLLGAGNFLETNVLGTYTLLNLARQSGVQKFIQISTDEVYGAIATGSATEDAALHPNNPYAKSKAAADLLVGASDVPAVIIRSTNNFGPRQHLEKLIPLFIANALENKPLPLYGDGRHIRDWIFVEDCCAAIDFLTEHGRVGETYNVAGGNEVENLLIAQRICERLGKPESLIQFVKDRSQHDRRYSLNAGKLANLGWQPPSEFSAALNATIDWYAANPGWWKPLKNSEFQTYYQTQYSHRL